MRVTFDIPRPLFATDPRPVTVEMDAVPRIGEMVIIDGDWVQGQVAEVIWSIASNGIVRHEVEVRLR